MNGTGTCLDIDQDLLECWVVFWHKVILVDRANCRFAHARDWVGSERDGAFLRHSSCSWILQVGERHIACAQTGRRSNQQLANAEICAADLAHNFGALVVLPESKEAQCAPSTGRDKRPVSSSIGYSHVQFKCVVVRADLTHTQ